MTCESCSLGILSAERPTSNPPFGSQTEPFVELINIATKKKCSSFIFTLEDIDWNNKNVYGYIPNGSNSSWKRSFFPLPKVIYNRIPNRKLEQKDEYQQILRKIKNLYGRKFFNPFFLNKWTVYKILSGGDQKPSWLPKTSEFSMKSLSEMLKEYQAVFLKPIENSLGLGIFKISINSNKQIMISSNRTSAEITCLKEIPYKWPNLPFFVKPYLIQQGINLTSLSGLPFDFRVLIQKDKRGKWLKTGLAARVAGENRITTHILYNGTRAPADEVLNQVFDKPEKRNIYQKIARYGKIAAYKIENFYAQNFGEMEMDIGIDKLGKPWILEVNSKPFKFDEPLIRAKSLVRLLDYIIYLQRT